MAVPDAPKIYHLTHVDNLARIVEDGALLSDALIIANGGPDVPIGMSEIKLRRLEELQVQTHPGTFVGEYVPFYFCPRSIMLYIFWRDNHPAITYHGGQEPLVHLKADLTETVEALDLEGRRWAFSLSNAGARYAEFRSDLEALDEVDWEAVESHDFRNAEVKEGKQAEFLAHERFPFALVEEVGVHSEAIREKTAEILSVLDTPPPVVIRPSWYY